MQRESHSHQLSDCIIHVSYTKNGSEIVEFENEPLHHLSYDIREEVLSTVFDPVLTDKAKKQILKDFITDEEFNQIKNQPVK